jgi:hypothetical protein
MSDRKRDLKDSVTKRDLIIASIVAAFILLTAILSYFYGDYGILRYISGGEKLFRFWIIVGLIILGIECFLRIRKKRKRRG